MPSGKLQVVALREEDKPEDLSHTIIVVTILTTVLCFFSVVARLICRRYIKNPLEAADWLLIMALLPFAGMQATVIVQITSGMGQRIEFASNVARYEDAIIPAQMFYILTFVFVKLSVLYLYRRLFSINQKLLHVSMILMFLVIAYSLATIIVVVVQCRPNSGPWIESGVNGICIYQGSAFKAFASLNIATNFAILVLPVKYILGLQMGLCSKLHVIGLFMIGSIICVVTILRLTLKMKADPHDTTFAGGEGTLWSQIELNIAFVCACSTTYRPMCLMGKATFFKLKSITSNALSRTGSIRQSSMSDMPLQAKRRESGRSEVISTLGSGCDSGYDTHDDQFAEMEHAPVNNEDVERGAAVQTKSG